MNRIYSILLVLLLFPALCVADNHEKKPQLIADSWSVTPKADHGNEFEEALKAHLAMRAEKGDPREWHVYVPVTGDDLNRYVIRSCCFQYADQDSYGKWSQENMGQHWNETVHPHVKSYAHNYSELDAENSNWGDDTVANYVGVTMFHIKPGKGGKMGEAIADMSTLAKENDWARNWSWFYPVGGSSSVGLATPFENYAQMAPMEENFYQFAKKHLKSEKKADKMFDKFGSAHSGSEYTIWRHRKDFMKKEEE